MIGPDLYPYESNPPKELYVIGILFFSVFLNSLEIGRGARLCHVFVRSRAFH